MKVYLVRHGQSESNAKKVRLGATAQLTDKGRDQAKFLAKRFRDITIDQIVASTLIRATQTAEIIGEEIGQGFIQSDLLVERKNPSETIGLADNDPVLLEVARQSKLHLLDPNWHYSDEENFNDQKERALKALDFLKGLDKENVLVVGHGVFSRMLVGCAIWGEKLDLEIYWQFLLSLRTTNTSITVLETNNPWSSNEGKLTDWTLITWNDHAHLGEIK